jgi:eukaryotic-like serine/threonine-protein kinase
MSLAPGTRIGPYEVLSMVGAGGMGEVYRARDTRLGRDVAIKVLPSQFSDDPERLRRFEQEARAAGSLNHPNILTIFDIGAHDAAPYVVSELLEGETLRDRLAGSRLPQRKAIDYAQQIAQGLTAAHERGIVHRDLKPENIFISSDDRVKILDFGLAKLTNPGVPSTAQTELPTIPFNRETDAGVIVGTVGYMSPEQVRGERVDHRSDIFSFGAVLYEMISGGRAFRGDTAVETLNAILKEDPPQPLDSHRGVTPALARIVEHCLEKNPLTRFQSARDLAFALGALAGSSTSTAAAPAPGVLRPTARLWLRAAVGLLAVMAVAAFFLGRRAGFAAGERAVRPPDFRRVTFRPGAIHSAKFAPDGQTIVYSAKWEGEPLEVFSTRSESPESRPLGLLDADVLAISSLGEVAILLRPSSPAFLATGTLARMPISGGAPREILEDVSLADWAPDGSQLAVIRQAGGRHRLEFPIGRVLYETSERIASMRVAPKGDLIALGEQNSVSVVDLAGRRSILSEREGTSRVAWSPTGNEVWFSAAERGFNDGMYAVTLAKRERLLTRGPDALFVQDISRDGHTLVQRVYRRKGLYGLLAGQIKESDLSWLEWTHIADISADGRTILFMEAGEGGGIENAVYLRKTDGSAPVRLGVGIAQALSPDGKWALAIGRSARRDRLILLPTGAGESKQLTTEGISWQTASWLPDGKRILLVGEEPGHARRSYIQHIEGGAPRAVTPEGMAGSLVSPDGTSIIVATTQGRFAVFPLSGGEPRPIPGLLAGDEPIRWAADPRSIYLRRNVPDSPIVQVYRLDLTAGHRELWKEIVPDPSMFFSILPIVITPDGQYYAYSYGRFVSDLYLVDGLK